MILFNLNVTEIYLNINTELRSRRCVQIQGGLFSLSLQFHEILRSGFILMDLEDCVFDNTMLC